MANDTKATEADIVERIRLRQDWPGRLADEAADEIERLRGLEKRAAFAAESGATTIEKATARYILHG